MDNTRLCLLPDGGLSPNVSSFPESQTIMTSANSGKGIVCSARNVESLSNSRSESTIVAHRPWEDGVPNGSKWNSLAHFCGSVVPPWTRKPKKFKPILLYHRPEDTLLPHRVSPYGGHDKYSMCDVDKGLCCYCEDYPGSIQETRSRMDCNQFYKTGVSSVNSSDYLHCSCSCGFWPNPSFNFNVHLNQCAYGSPETCPVDDGSCKTSEQFRRLHCCGTCSWTPDGRPASHYPRDSLSMSPHGTTYKPAGSQISKAPSTFQAGSQITSTPPPFLVAPRSHFLLEPLPPEMAQKSKNQTRNLQATPHTPKPYFSMMARHPSAADHGSASEIRRALLLNHPVFAAPSKESTGYSFPKPSNLPSKKRTPARMPQSSDSRFSGSFCANSEKTGTKWKSTPVTKDQNEISSSFTTSLPINPMASRPIYVGPPACPSAMSHTATSRRQLPTSTSQLGPNTPPTYEPVNGVEWQQNWAGNYGSFLQFLNSPDCPTSMSSNPPAPLVKDQPVPEVMTMRPSSSMPTPLQNLPQHTGVACYSESPGKDINENSEERENRRHKCPFCYVICTNNGQLKGHLRVHTGERPYKCDCGRAFARNEELTRHRRIHSGLRPHHCSTCGKKFGRKDHLNKHQKTHLRTSEKKTHQCQVSGCRQRYTRSDALARHQWGAHGIKARTSRIKISAMDGQTSVETRHQS